VTITALFPNPEPAQTAREQHLQALLLSWGVLERRRPRPGGRQRLEDRLDGLGRQGLLKLAYALATDHQPTLMDVGIAIDGLPVDENTSDHDLVEALDALASTATALADQLGRPVKATS